MRKLSGLHRGAGAALVAVAALLAIGAPTTALAQDTEPIIVVDQGAGTVAVVSENSDAPPLVSDLVNPRGVALSPDGQLLLVVESGSSPGQGRLMIVMPDGSLEPIADGLDFPEAAAFLDDQTVIFTTVGDQSISEINLATRAVELIIQIESAPTGLVLFDSGDADGAGLFLGVSTWNGLGLLFNFETGDFQPFTDILGGGGHPDFRPDLGMCIPEFEQNRVSCWSVDGGPPALIDGFDGPVGVAFLPSGFMAVSHSGGVSVVNPLDGTVIYTLPFDNPAAMVVPGERSPIWLPPSAPVTTSTSTATADAAGADDEVAVDPGSDGTDDSGVAATGEEGSNDSNGSGMWLLLVALLAALAALAVWFARSRRQRTSDDIAPPPAASEPDKPLVAGAAKDPCEEICEAAERAQAAAEAAETQAEAAETEAAEAEAEAETAAQDATDSKADADSAEKASENAGRAHDSAKNPPAHSGGYAKSGDREYTGADNDRVEAERGRIDDEVAAGDKTQQEAQAEKAELSDPKKWEELREKEETDQAAEVEKAREKAEQAKKDQQIANEAANEARDSADDAASRAADLRTAADDAKQKADDARRDAEAKKKACEECLGKAAIEGAGGEDSWITQQGGVGGPCSEGDEPKTVERTDTFFVLDESREVEIEDKSIRPQRISDEDLGLIKSIFSTIGTVLGIGSKVPILSKVVKLPMAYLSFVSRGAAGIIDDMEKALKKSRRKGGLSDYYFVKITIPRHKITVTCVCTIECHEGVWTCTGCQSSETVENGDLSKESEGSREEVEKFIAGMQAQAQQAKAAQESKDAFVAGCSCG